MASEDEIKKTVFQVFLEKVFGISKVSSFVSYDGVIGRNQFFLTTLLWAICVRSVALLKQPLLSYICGLLLFYCVLAMVQKRCRDLGYKGTFCILIYSITTILTAAFYFVDETEFIFGWRVITLIFAICLVITFIFLAYKIGKVEPDLNVRSPLLKYPLLYVGAVWLICIAATLTVNHYAGVTIPLW